MRRLSELLSQVSPISEAGTIRWKSLWLLYALANFFIVLTWNAKFWDAWYFYADVDALEIAERNCPIDQCKVPLTYLVEQPLLRIGDWTLKLVVVCGFAVAGWLFWRLLKYTTVLSEFQCSVAAILFILLPINGARVGLSTARASYLLPVFLLGAVLLTYKRALLSCIGFLLVLFAGFWPSYQVFALSIALVLAANDLSSRNSVSRRTATVAVALLTIPFLHRYVLEPLIVDLGLAAAPGSYNSIRLNFLIRATLVCGMLATPLLGSLTKQIAGRRSLNEWRPSLSYVGMGLLALGTFPYMAVGHFANLSDWVLVWLPDNSDWDSRHQLLQGPGFALIITAVLTSAIVPHRRIFGINILVAISVAISIATYSNYHVDGLKQRDIMNDLRAAAGDFENVSVVSFVDESLDLNARGRSIRSYEWEKMAEVALEKPMTVWEESALQVDCQAEVVGKTVTVRKASGRLKATITRGRVVTTQISDIVACRQTD